MNEAEVKYLNEKMIEKFMKAVNNIVNENKSNPEEIMGKRIAQAFQYVDENEKIKTKIISRTFELS